MNNNRIISIDQATKTQYFLFNFYGPVAFVFVALMSVKLYKSVWAFLFLVFILVFSLILAIYYYKKYNQFLVVNEDSIYVCSGKPNSPKVIENIHLSEIPKDSFTKNFELKINKRKINLLYTQMPAPYLILYIGPLIFIPMLKQHNVLQNKLSELHSLLPQEFTKPQSDKQNPALTVIGDVLMWLFVGLITFLGCIPLFMVFYMLYLIIFRH